MNDLLATTSATTTIVPVPRVAISVRVGTMDDLPFLDSLQKKYGKALGYFPTKQFEGYIAMGGILIAEANGERVGYCISRDRYQKRDELGVIYQLCVSPQRQRGLIGAALVREVFERSAYGCKLYCCWCAQDLDANYFWESLGFVPLAFRAGSDKKRRVHILWERRIREGDTTTPWWYPCNTNGGAMREDRLAFPIPPGVKWSDEMPMILPCDTTPKLEDAITKPEVRSTKPIANRKSAIGNAPPPAPKQLTTAMIGMRFEAPKPEPVAKAKKEPKQKAPREKAKNDPKHVAAARELRDRYLEHVNSGAMALESAGKYDVARALSAVEGARALPSTSTIGAPALPSARRKRLTRAA